MTTKGIYLENGRFLPFGKVERPASGMIASRDRVNLLGLAYYLPNPDSVLRKMGKNIDVYNELRKDPTVGGLVRRRRAAVLSLERGLDPDYRGSARVRRDVEDMLAGLKLDRVIREMLNGSLFGYQPMEIMWEISNSKYRPIDVQAKPPQWFFFDSDNQLRLRTLYDPLGEIVSPAKFLLPRQDPTYENPYGEADLSMCFWPVTFKKGGLKSWVKFTEKYGMPMAVGKLPRGVGDGGESDDLLDKLEQMVQDAVAVIPDDSSVELLEAKSGAGNAELYERLLMWCRSEISIALVGQNQTTESSSTKASASAGLEVTDDIRDGDAGMVMECINQLIAFYCFFNYGLAADECPTYKLWEQEDVDDKQAKRDVSLVSAGARFTPDYFQRAYKLQPNDLDVAAMKAVPLKLRHSAAPPDEAAPAFAEVTDLAFADQQTLDDIVDAIAEEKLPGVAADLIKPLVAAIQSGEDAETLLGRLGELFPEMDDITLQESLGGLMFVADTVGRLSVQGELADG